MHLNELISLIAWVNVNVRDAQLVKKYNQLHSVLNQNAQPNQQKQPFESQRNELDKALCSMPVTDLGLGQIAFLENCGLMPSLGNEAADTIDAILRDHTHDLATIAQKIAEMRDPINAVMASLKKIEEGINELYECPEEEYEEALVHVHFDGDAGIYNIADLKKWSSSWYDIGRGIAMAVGDKPEDCRVVGASHGSIIVALATTYGIAKVVSQILLIAIKVRERVVDLEIQQEKLRGLRLSNDAAEKALQKEIDDEIKSGESRAVDQLNNELEMDGEQKGALEKSVKTSFAFINKGGLIDVHVHQSGDEQDEGGGDEGVGDPDQRAIERQEVLKIAREIRTVEERIKAIEHKSEGYDG